MSKFEEANSSSTLSTVATLAKTCPALHCALVKALAAAESETATERRKAKKKEMLQRLDDARIASAKAANGMHLAILVAAVLGTLLFKQTR